jgi:broad specificity phosphatase PhoE
MVERRVLHAIDLLASRWRGKEIAIVSHEIPIRLLVSRSTDIDGAAIWDIPLPTGSVTTLSGSPRAWWVVSGPSAA